MKGMNLVVPLLSLIKLAVHQPRVHLI